MQWLWIKYLNASSKCSDHPTLSLVVRIKNLNAPSQPCRIFNPSTGSAREEDSAIAKSWFSYNINIHTDKRHVVFIFPLNCQYWLWEELPCKKMTAREIKRFAENISIIDNLRKKGISEIMGVEIENLHEILSKYRPFLAPGLRCSAPIGPDVHVATRCGCPNLRKRREQWVSHFKIDQCTQYPAVWIMSTNCASLLSNLQWLRKWHLMQVWVSQVY